MEDWHVTFRQQGKKLADLARTPRDLIKQEEDKPQRIFGLDEMEESRQREARCISNYFNIPSISSFAQTLITAAKILRIDPHPIMNKMDSAKIKISGAPLENAEQTTRSRIELCFSRRWRELQSTIYLLIQEYETPQRNLRTRVLVINQRGLILQSLSNINSAKTFIFVGKVLQTSYTRLQNLVVLQSAPAMVNLDSIAVLREAIPTVNVVMVTYGDMKQVEMLSAGDIKANSSLYLIGSDIKLSVYRQLGIILWYVEQNNEQQLQGMLVGLAGILKCERQVSHYFKDFQYGHHQFNQKQFLLRLFSFYFNFIALGMQNYSEDEMKAAVLEQCTDQLLSKQRELQVRGGEEEVHSFTTMPTSLHCPVCRRRSKITCLKCCVEFGSKFAICEVSCFEKFHQDRIGYAGKINKRKKVDDLVMQNREKDQKEAAEKGEEAEPAMARVQTMAELRDKWRTAMEGQQRDFEHFLRMSQMNFIPRKFVDRVHLLRVKIGEISGTPLLIQTSVKKEQ